MRLNTSSLYYQYRIQIITSSCIQNVVLITYYRLELIWFTGIGEANYYLEQHWKVSEPKEFTPPNWASLLIKIVYNPPSILQVHRVIIPEEELKRSTPRRSVAFFYDPDWTAKITCLDGSNKYPPIKCSKYVSQVMTGTFSF